jgi:hypothetical protein
MTSQLSAGVLKMGKSFGGLETLGELTGEKKVSFDL